MEKLKDVAIDRADVEASIHIPSDLEQAKIRSIPSTAYYIADFISKEEEQALLGKIASAPKPRWKQLSRRRLQTWPSDLSTKDALLDVPLPDWLITPIVPRLLSISRTSDEYQSHIFDNSPHKEPNHVLINEYLPGQGIMPHKDGAAYHPVVCTVSLYSSLCLEIYGTNPDGTTDKKPKWRILQEPRSLLITTDQLYTDYLHGIAQVEKESDLGSDTVANWDLLRSQGEVATHIVRESRTSLTYRDVIKVSKLSAKLGLLNRH